MMYQTYLKDCNCEFGGIIIHSNIPVCRWCRTPYGEGGMMNYLEEHFVRPPLGIKPEFLLKEHRLKELYEAMKRYREARYSIPDEWWEEKYAILGWLYRHHPTSPYLKEK